MVLANYKVRNSSTSKTAIDPTAVYTALWNNSAFGMYVLEVIDAGTDFRFIAFNQTCAEQSPIPIETLQGKRLTTIFPEKVDTPYLHNHIRCVQTQKAISFEESLSLNEQTTYWQLTLYPLLTPTQAVNQLLVTSVDITDKIIAQAQNLRMIASRKIVQQVLDKVPTTIFWKDFESRYLGCNQAFADIAGQASTDEIIGKTDYDLAWKREESDWFVACDQRIMNDNQPDLNIIEPQLQANGRQAWLKTSKIPLHDNDGNVSGILGIIEDITDRKEVEENQARLLTILEATPDIISITNTEGKHRYLNQAGQHIAGIEPSQVSSFKLRNFTHPEMTAQLLTVALPTAKSAGIWSGESIICDSQGNHIPVSQVILFHQNETGDNQYFSSIMRDISDRKAAETSLKEQSEELSHTIQQLQKTQAQVIQTEKMSSLGQMVAGIAHEINNPVNFIHGNIQPAFNYINELLEIIELYQATYPNTTEEIKETLDSLDLDFVREDLPKLLTSMSMGTTRIREIVLSLRNFSRLDESEVKTVDLHEGIDSTLVILNHRLKTGNLHNAIQVVKRYQVLPLVACYPSQLNQVFMNILANAIDALETQQNPIITIFTEQTGNSVNIRIRDNGTGIPEAVQPQILDPFFTTKDIGKGTGMGMSISYQIVVEKHGGQLWFTSKEGQGTEFCITIPTTQPNMT